MQPLLALTHRNLRQPNIHQSIDRQPLIIGSIWPSLRQLRTVSTGLLETSKPLFKTLRPTVKSTERIERITQRANTTLILWILVDQPLLNLQRLSERSLGYCFVACQLLDHPHSVIRSGNLVKHFRIGPSLGQKIFVMS